jgi:hypothetical protein
MKATFRDCAHSSELLHVLLAYSYGFVVTVKGSFDSEQGISGYTGNIVTTDCVFESSLRHGCMCECLIIIFMSKGLSHLDT